jgi:hypothetical protein
MRSWLASGSYYEIMAGIRQLKSLREEKFFRHFFSDVEILELSLAAADIASGIGARMDSSREPGERFGCSH